MKRVLRGATAEQDSRVELAGTEAVRREKGTELPEDR
jgi:hypothetical protein